MVESMQLFSFGYTFGNSSSLRSQRIIPNEQAFRLCPNEESIFVTVSLHS